MRVLIRVLAILALLVSAAWLYTDFSHEPGMALILSLSGLISTFFFRTNQENVENKDNQDKKERSVQVTYKDRATHKGDNRF